MSPWNFLNLDLQKGKFPKKNTKKWKNC